MAFITSLRIKNFFSIKNEVTIDFKASPYNIEHNPDRLFEFNGEYYNKIISFYRANASGKTSMLKAIGLLASVIRNEQTDNFPVSFKNNFSSLPSFIGAKHLIQHIDLSNLQKESKLNNTNQIIKNFMVSI